ncbi:MAG TPA: hypothetical protein VIE39_06090 [Thermoanaerobaculia bacterium]|jgi:hypothetical protein
MRSQRASRGAALAALAVLALGLLSPAAFGQERVRNHFDFDKAFGEPGFFDFVVLTGEGKARWMIIPDPEHNPPSTPNQVTQSETERPAGSIAAAIRRTYVLRDGVVTVAVKRQAGVAGLVLRMAGEKDYLLVLLGGDGAIETTSTRGGTATSLAKGKASLDREWNVLSVELSGASVKVSVNDKPILEATDPAPASGRTGLATQGPGSAAFDELWLEIRG